MGHVRNYSIGDALARYMWMNGYNVLHPMGWTRSVCRRRTRRSRTTHAREWTLRNIANMKVQMKRSALPMTGRAKSPLLPSIPLEPVVLFEDVRARSRLSQEEQGELVPEMRDRARQRAGRGRQLLASRRHAVEQRELEQWFLRITKYADELLRDLAKLDGWPEKVRIMQRNWIGRSEGAFVDFDLGGTVGPAGSTVTVFTTRVDTIYGATSVQLAPSIPSWPTLRERPGLARQGRSVDRGATQGQRSW